MAEPLIDPDCAAGKCGSCVGDPCEHYCHVPQRGMVSLDNGTDVVFAAPAAAELDHANSHAREHGGEHADLRARLLTDLDTEPHFGLVEFVDAVMTTLAAYADADTDERIAAAVSSAVPDGAVLTERDIVAEVKAAIAPDLAELARLRGLVTAQQRAIHDEITAGGQAEAEVIRLRNRVTALDANGAELYTRLQRTAAIERRIRAYLAELQAGGTVGLIRQSVIAALTRALGDLPTEEDQPGTEEDTPAATRWGVRAPAPDRIRLHVNGRRYDFAPEAAAELTQVIRVILGIDQPAPDHQEPDHV